MTKHLRRAILLCLLGYPALVMARNDQPWSFNFFLENDLFANTDLNYTNGIRLSTISPDLAGFKDPKGQKYPWVEKLNRLLEFAYPAPENRDADPVKQNMAISLGQLMFTPADKNRTTVDPDDRPYAGWLYLGLGYHARTATTLHSTEFDFGMVGPAALARQSQNLIHRLRGLGLFQGWDNQLKNEPAFQLIFERKHKNPGLRWQLTDSLALETITHWGGSIGNVASYFNAGAEFRLGRDLPDDFGTSTLRPGGDNNTPGSRAATGMRPGFHVFLAMDGRTVLNNIFLDGNTFRHSHSVDRKWLVADVAGGVALSYRRLRFSYAHIYRTKEFRGQAKAQFYGSLSLSYRHEF